VNIRETGWVVVNWTRRGPDSDQWRALGPKNAGEEEFLD
jgi:hypothetical protein